MLLDALCLLDEELKDRRISYYSELGSINGYNGDFNLIHVAWLKELYEEAKDPVTEFIIPGVLALIEELPPGPLTFRLIRHCVTIEKNGLSISRYDTEDVMALYLLVK